MKLVSRIKGFFGQKEKLRRELSQERRRTRALNKAIVAATLGKGVSGWPGMPADEDALNKEYLTSLVEVMQRSQDLDVNNPDVHGFHRTRAAQVVGSGVAFKATPRPSEVGLSPKQLLVITEKLNRLRELHSNLGGFDSTGNNRSEGTQQERAVLTTFITGCCLIHRVWRTDARALLPFSLELIPGTRISTPDDRMGDPKVSYGIEYSDEHRTRVVGYHVRRVSRTRGDSLIPDYTWDFLPAVDCSLLSLTEMAGLDRAMPLSLSVVRMLRNRGEFIESAVEAARAQAKIYAARECAPGQDPWAAAQDDTDEAAAEAGDVGFMTMGGVQMLYLNNGEKMNWNSARLPDPDFPGFMDVTDSRCARGFVSSKSRFTREVTSSWAGGRMEDQQDEPIVAQYRSAFVSAWRRVHEWFLEAAWLTGAVEMPGYSDATKGYWAQCRAEFPGKLHINPVDTMSAREKAFALRSTTPQQSCEEDGKDLRENLRQWGEALQLVADVEKEFNLPDGSLAFTLSGQPIVSTAEDPSKNEFPPAGRTSLNRLRHLLEGAR